VKYVDLFRVSLVTIERHVKITSAATPFAPYYKEYFERRERHQRNSHARSGLVMQFQAMPAYTNASAWIFVGS